MVIMKTNKTQQYIWDMVSEKSKQCVPVTQLQLYIICICTKLVGYKAWTKMSIEEISGHNNVTWSIT